MLRASQAAVEVVGGDQVKFERAAVAAEVALDEHDGDSRLRHGAEEGLVLPGRVVAEPRRHEDQARDPVLGRAPGLAAEVGRARRLVEVEAIVLYLESPPAAPGRRNPPARTRGSRGSRARACCAAPGQIAPHSRPQRATKLPERSIVRISPLSLSTWIARDAVTTETPNAEATSRELGTFAPSRPATRDSIARAISRYLGNVVDGMRIPEQAFFPVPGAGLARMRGPPQK